MNDMKVAFEVRLTEMNPLKHIQLALDFVGESSIKRDVVLKWKRVIKSLVEQEKAFLEKGAFPQGLHPLIAGFPTGFFAYLFELGKLSAYVIKHDISPIRLPVAHLIRYIDQQQLDPIHRFEEKNDQNPITVLESSLFNQPFCISGSLKIADAFKQGKGKLSVHYLMPDDYLHLMFDDLSRAMHMFHLDVQKVSESLMPPREDSLYLSRKAEFLTLPA